MAQSEADSDESMITMHDLVFLFDVDNTLLDNDRVQTDLAAYLTKTFGVDACKLYSKVFHDLAETPGVEIKTSISPPRRCTSRATKLTGDCFALAPRDLPALKLCQLARIGSLLCASS